MSFRLVQLRRLFDIVNGGTPTSEDENWDGDVAWATPVDLADSDGTLIHQTARTLTEDGLRSGSRSVPPRSLILSTRAPIGYVSETTVEMAFNQGCRGLVPRSDLDTRFFRYQLSAAKELLQNLGQGSTFVELSTDALGGYRLLCPPSHKQRSIAVYLDTETAHIDALITKKRRLTELLDEQAQAALLNAVGDWRSRPSRTLRQYGTSVLTGPFGTVLSASEYVDGGVPLVNPTHIRSGEIVPEDGVSVPEHVAARIDRHRLSVGDLVMGRKGDVGRSAIVSPREDGWVCGSDSIAIRCGDDLEPEYLATALRIDLYRQQLARSSTGAMVLNVNEGTLLGLLLPDIERTEQLHAVQRSRDALARQTGLAVRLAQQIDLLTEKRQALITAAVTGELEMPVAA